MEGYIGEIRMFAGNFGPRYWALCSGQLMSIAQNSALFALLGTTFGGDGITNFGVPDLRGRGATGTGQGPSLSAYIAGQAGGTESFTLTASNVSGHTHPITGTAGILISSQDGHTPLPTNNFPAVNGDNIYSPTTDNSVMAPPAVALTIAPAGNASAQPISNLKPYLAMNFIICLEGIFPTQN